MKRYKIYLLILTYYGKKWINKCLSALAASPVVDPPIIISKGSIHSTTLFLLTQPDIEIVKTANNSGFRSAYNTGLNKVVDNDVRHAIMESFLR